MRTFLSFSCQGSDELGFEATIRRGLGHERWTDVHAVEDVPA